eukprot:m.137976 g.137976  ORF g.137976 m.137976 type:complete len:222 (+) comp38233_c0_seq14:34-699(+)
MSGGLAPSRTTVYCSNLPFKLTNSDLHKIFEKYGKLVKVTIMKDKQTRNSKGVAFVLFLDRQSAQNAVTSLNGKEMFGRTLKCSVAKDNGRAADFIKRKSYPDKSRCYECGEEGHLSYECPKNALGERERPKKKERKRRRGNADVSRAKHGSQNAEADEEEEEDVDAEDDDFTLSEAIRLSQKERERDERTTVTSSSRKKSLPNTRKAKPSGYFSDEEISD